MPLEEEEKNNFGSRKAAAKQETEEGEINEDDFREKRKKQIIEADATTKKLTLKDLDLDFSKKRRNESDEDDDGDEIKREPIDNNFTLDEDGAFNDLHNALDKVRKRVVTNKIEEVLTLEFISNFYLTFFFSRLLKELLKKPQWKLKLNQ